MANLVKIEKIISGIKFNIYISKNIFAKQQKIINDGTFYTTTEPFNNYEIYNIYYIDDNDIYIKVLNKINSFSEKILIYQSRDGKKEYIYKTIIGEIEYFYNHQDKVCFLKYKNIFYIYTGEDTRNKDRHFYRLIRPIIIKHFESRGAFVLHGSAIEYNNQAIIFLGDKGAGKTTILFKLLENSQSKFISNDKIIVYPFENNYVVIPIPMPTRVTIKTLSNNDFVLQKLKYYKLDRYKDILNVNLYKEINPCEKIELLNKEISDLLETSISHGGKLKYIFNPQIDLNIEKNYLEKLDKETASSILDRNVYSPYDYTWPTEWILKNHIEKNKYTSIINSNKLVLMERFFLNKIMYNPNNHLDDFDFLIEFCL